MGTLSFNEVVVLWVLVKGKRRYGGGFEWVGRILEVQLFEVRYKRRFIHVRDACIA